jgi:hypothetical protein
MPEEVKSQTRRDKRKERRQERREARPNYAKRKARRDKRTANRAERAEAYKNRERYSTAKRLNIDQLRYQFDQGARPNRYEVNFYCPKLGLSLEGVRCINATLPGRQLETADWSEYGPTRKMPYMLGMDGQEVSFTFICDSSFADRFLIEAWQGAIFMGRTGTTARRKANDELQQDVVRAETAGDLTEDEAQAKLKALTGKLADIDVGNSINPQFEYYENYVGEIVIKQITRSDKKSLQYRIHEAYPISFAPMELSAESTDELMKFETTFAFRTWESEYSNPNPVSGINKGRRFFDLWASVTNLRKGGNSSNNTLQRFNDRLARLGGIFG